jgi:hypothetical protein
MLLFMDVYRLAKRNHPAGQIPRLNCAVRRA